MALTILGPRVGDEPPPARPRPPAFFETVRDGWARSLAHHCTKKREKKRAAELAAEEASSPKKKKKVVVIEDDEDDDYEYEDVDQD